jgi:hypothetical protein
MGLRARVVPRRVEAGPRYDLVFVLCSLRAPDSGVFFPPNSDMMVSKVMVSHTDTVCTHQNTSLKIEGIVSNRDGVCTSSLSE